MPKKYTNYKLVGEKYHQITQSHELPEISAADLVKFLIISRKKGQTAALKSFREWLGKNKKYPEF